MPTATRCGISIRGIMACRQGQEPPASPASARHPTCSVKYTGQLSKSRTSRVCMTTHSAEVTHCKALRWKSEDVERAQCLTYRHHAMKTRSVTPHEGKKDVRIQIYMPPSPVRSEPQRQPPREDSTPKHIRHHQPRHTAPLFPFQQPWPMQFSSFALSEVQTWPRLL